MNRHVVRALLQDAVAQVFDNRIFRLLVILVGGLVLPTFLIGAREDRLVVLFGWREYEYEKILGFLDKGIPAGVPANELLIGIVQQIFVEVFAGFFGILVCLCVTAFFVPRMLEKGSADTLFSKPVSRWTLLLFRYVSGVLFVSILALLLVGGIHLGLLINSGYSDPGFLWAAPVVIYLFALLHGVSTLAGVATRSSVAAILITFTFFMFNGCVHQLWIFKEHQAARTAQEQVETSELDEALEESGSFDKAKGFLIGLADVLHYTLPKTGDAPRIAEMLRKSLERGSRAWYDAETKLVVEQAPEGFVRDTAVPEGTVAWRSVEGTRGGSARIALRRDTRVVESDPENGRTRRRSAALLASELENSLEDEPGVSSLVRDIRAEPVANTQTATVTWTESAGGGLRYRKTYLFTRLDWAYSVEVTGPEEWIDDPAERAPVDAFLAGFSFEADASSHDPGTWYASNFGWQAPLRFNAYFSIGSSLAFTVLVLVLAWALLARIDF